MKTIYFISGLGADSRVFRKMKFPEYKLIYLDWIPPLEKESLADYALRLGSGIDHTQPFYLIGLSLGGMIATEISRKLNPLHTFLISSAPTYLQLPWYFRLAGNLRLQKILTTGLIKQSKFLPAGLLGGKTPEEKTLLKTLIRETDPLFMKWALTAILEWRNTEKPMNLTHLHGTADRTIPIRYTSPDLIVKGGGHFMVYADAAKVTELINEILKQNLW
ncbi:alpha/beta hydrolase [Pedobacter frigoris]|uniref:alpha/beta hydrolase n=1 Tax=Pedobacter frigoris TaxID=2571272 RepID=UPI00292F5EC7|nr:alpha/beta hydrolase [Pedobacter frigoris]